MIRLLITGGTFDKNYDRVAGELTFSHSHLPEILETVGCTVPVTLQIIELVDSLEMSDAQRQRIVDAVAASPERRVVITHGTDTMTVTAELLLVAMRDDPGMAGRTVVLTGAMVPFTVVGSDALFNLGSAMVAAQLLDSGVYIAMHGQVFAAGAVVKDRAQGRFVPNESGGGI